MMARILYAKPAGGVSMVPLCCIAVVAALGGLATVALALGSAAGLTSTALLAAPAFGAVSLVAGLAAAAVAMRRYG
jgi:hypothetical protein